MRLSFRMLIVAGCCLCLSSTSAMFGPVEPLKLTPEIRSLVNGNNQFAFDLYRPLAKTKGNLFYSPYSVSTALGIPYAGARGVTEKEMAKVLHYELSQKQLHPAMGELSSFLNQSGGRGYQLEVANRLWTRKGLPLLAPFTEVMNSHYQAGVVPLDFGDTEEARKTINGWVEKKTQSRIKEILEPGLLSSDTSLVLANAIYFKGNWQDAFKKSDTEPMPFHESDGKTIDVDMMYQETTFRYGKFDGVQVVDLPYYKDALSMLVILPNKRDGLADVETKISAENITKWLPKMKQEKLSVYLPKFSLNSTFELSETLKALGMKSAFSQADFSGMSNDGTTFSLSRATLKAFVEVNEKGSEATSAFIDPIVLFAAPEIHEFKADHPFMFLIRDNHTQSILFIGRVATFQ